MSKFSDYYQRAKTDITKRASKEVNNFITKNIHDVKNKIGEKVNDITGLNYNDWDGVDVASFGVVKEEVTSTDNESGLHTNSLHKFATHNYILTLSGISEVEMKTHAFLDNPVHDIIARSGGIGNPQVSNGKFKQYNDKLKKEEDFYGSAEGKNFGVGNKTTNDTYDPTNSVKILNDGLDLFLEDLNLLSTVGPNAERGLANLNKLNFTVVEPFGVSLVEKVKAATFVNGYRDFMDAPLLLTIQFKGTDENGKQITAEEKNFERKIPILIVRVEFELDQAGTKYQCVAVPHGDLGHDDRFKFPKTQITTTVSSVGEWIKEVTKQLDQDQDLEISEGVRTYKDQYEFIVSNEVADQAKYAKTLSSTMAESNASLFTKFWNSYVAGEKTKIDTAPVIKLADAQVDGQTSLIKYFEDAIRTGEGYSAIADRFWQYWHMQMTGSTSSPTTVGPAKDSVDTGKVLTDFYNSDQFTAKAKDNQWIPWFEIKVSVETPNPELIDPVRKVSPKRIIFKAIPKRLHCLKFFPPGVSLGFMDWSKWVRKKYDYIYTGDNVDIQNLRIDYKVAYYLRNVRPFKDEYKAKGTYDKFEENLIKAFGSGDSDIRIEPSNISGTSSMNSNSNKSQQFYDYITNPQVDMIKIELEILGDPAFICQDQFINIHQDRSKKAKGIGPGVISKTYGSFNSENFQPMIELNFVRPPDDINDVKGTYGHMKFTGNKKDNTYSGIYQVTKVDSKFNQGAFTQTLYCVRLNQQQGGSIGKIVNSIINKDVTSQAESVKTEGWNHMDDYYSKTGNEEIYGIVKKNPRLSEEANKLMNNLGKKDFITGGKNPWKVD
tara:strand:+ start:711 stop:3200 length:2490 start_codon:yes stop_codon:yes gene_type:complete